MKARRWRLLWVGCIMLTIVSPALMVWWRIWQYHNAFVTVRFATQSTNLASLQPDAIAMTYDLLLSSQPAVKVLLSVIAAPGMLGFMVAVPVGFWAGLVLSDRYRYRARISRTTTLQQQVATLEKLWQQSIY